MNGTGRTGRATAAVAVSVVLWSSAYGLSAIVLVTASPAVLSELRLLLAVPVMLGMIALRRGPAQGIRAFLSAMGRRSTVLLAVTGVALFYLPSNLGLSLSSPGTAAVMSAALPVLTAVLAWWLIREPITPRSGLGIAVTSMGVAIASAGSGVLGWGAVLLVAGLLAYALYTVLLRGMGSRADPGGVVDPVVLATATALWGAVLLLPWLGWEVVSGAVAWPSTPAGWASVLFLALIVTAPTMALYNYGAERVRAAVSGAAAAAVPVLGYAFAVVLGEPFAPIKAAGGVLALAGIAITTIPRRPRGPMRRPAATSAPRVASLPVTTGVCDDPR